MKCCYNGRYRPYANVAELAIMNVQRQIKRVAERHMRLINDYSEQGYDLFPSDHINGKMVSVAIIYYGRLS
jgi:hypothetical protein